MWKVCTWYFIDLEKADDSVPIYSLWKTARDLQIGGTII